MAVPVQHPMYIDGQFVAWQGDAWIDVINPATEARWNRRHEIILSSAPLLHDFP